MFESDGDTREDPAATVIAEALADIVGTDDGARERVDALLPRGGSEFELLEAAIGIMKSRLSGG